MQEHKDQKNLIEQGFTLIELLVVIAILGILAAVVVFSVQGITNRGDQNACKAEVATVNTAIQAFYAEQTPGSYPTATDAAGLGVQLVNAKLLAAGAVLPGATAGHSPAYDNSTGNFTASC